MDDAIAFAADKWLYYNDTLKFRPDVPLLEIITGFMMPMEQGLQNKFPSLRGVPPAISLLIVAKGIERSGTHTKQQIEDALGAPLPE